jgi:hypothetical protein
MSKPVKPKQKISLNPLEGQFDLVTSNNFSYESIPANKKLKIPDNNQMVIYEEFDLLGELQLDGSLILQE